MTQVDVARKKSGQPARGPLVSTVEEIPNYYRGPVTLTKMYRGYSMKVRGELPDDIVERISELHSVALRADVR